MTTRTDIISLMGDKKERTCYDMAKEIGRSQGAVYPQLQFWILKGMIDESRRATENGRLKIYYKIVGR